MNEMKFIKEFKEVVKEVGGDAYLVGGFVRDRLINKNSSCKDIDIIYDGDINALLNHLRGKSYEFFEDKENKNTYISIIDESLIKISKIKCKFIEDDLKERDFTINTICLKMVDNKIIDPFKGRRAIEARIIQQVTEESIIKDPIRILRGIRFYVKYGMHFSLETENSITENAIKLKKCSCKKIIAELMKIINCDKSGRAFDFLYDYNIITNIFPYEKELKNNFNHMNLMYQAFKDITNEILELRGLDVNLFEEKLGEFTLKEIISLIVFLNDISKYEIDELKEDLSIYSKLGFSEEINNLADNIMQGQKYINELFKKETDSYNKDINQLFKRYDKYIPYIVVVLFCSNYADIEEPSDKKEVYRTFIQNIINKYNIHKKTM